MEENKFPLIVRLLTKNVGAFGMKKGVNFQFLQYLPVLKRSIINAQNTMHRSVFMISTYLLHICYEHSLFPLFKNRLFQFVLHLNHFDNFYV